MKKIKGYKNVAEKLKDKLGYLKREVQLKRLGKYANEIDMVLTKYNKKSCDETMMVKGLRKSDSETTNRKIHQEDLEKIVIQMAKGIGLNTEIVAIMGKHHDIGHTFLGHSGEWWISSILEDYGLGYYCHNTIGARELIYTNNIYKEIIDKIKSYNPEIGQLEVDRIQDSLWLIMDGINAHNGEKPEKEYIPKVHKTQEEFINEMVDCYTKKGFDRTISPASIEACLMRLADQISYIPLDMQDGLREKMIRDENGNIVTTIDDDYKQILTQLGINEEEIESCNREGVYTKIAEKLKTIFIKDVIKNSTKQKIAMSKETMKLMNELRNINNLKIVNNVILVEDQQTYPKAIKTLIERYKEIILQNGLLEKMSDTENHVTINDLKQYKNSPDERFIKYISKMPKDDYDFTLNIVETATKQSISDELDIARKCVQEGTRYIPEEELGIEYNQKNARIQGYIEYYREMLDSLQLLGYDQKRKDADVEKVYNNIKRGKHNSNYLNMDERMAVAIAAKYISTLNDHEFIDLLQETNIINEQQRKSLTRKYKDIDLQKEVYIQENFKKISAAQKEATVEQKDNLNKQK